MYIKPSKLSKYVYTFFLWSYYNIGLPFDWRFLVFSGKRRRKHVPCLRNYRMELKQCRYTCLYIHIGNMILHIYNVMIQMIQRCNLLSLDGCCPFHLSVTRDQGLLLIILVQFQEIRHLIWVFTAAKRIHRVFLFRTPMPPPSIHHHPHETREHLTTYHHHCNHHTQNSVSISHIDQWSSLH